MKKQDKIKLIIVFGILVILIVYGCNVINVYLNYKNMKSDFIASEQTLLIYRNIKGNKKNNVTIFEKLKKEIYNNKGIVELFETITILSDISKINLISFQPEKNNEKFKLLIRGKYLNILKFIERLEKNRFFIQIIEFKIYLTDSQAGIVEADILCNLLR